MPAIRLSFCALLLSAWLVHAQDPPMPAAENPNLDLALKLTKESADKYQFKVGEADEEATLRKEPILRWSNPERGEIYGNVFLWTRRGRPVAVGSLFKWYSPYKHMSHEFHSLATDGLIGSRKDAEVWRTASPGVRFSPAPEAPEVGASPAARLTQMRQLAKDFSVKLTQRDGQVNSLRLLTQPVYRYEIAKETTDLADGGLFVFVQGTDPEMWLLFEAQRKDASSPAQWAYALARMNSIKLEVSHKSQPLTTFEALTTADVYRHKQPYTSFMFDMP